MSMLTALFFQVFQFGKGKASGAASKQILGGKGANLAEMSSIGLSVPPGMTITTEVCAKFHEAGCTLPDGVWTEVMQGLEGIEQEMGRKLGDASKPLLVSVRSGAAISMPGMMDTILNLGLNDATVVGLAKDFGERFAMVRLFGMLSTKLAYIHSLLQDSYRRFLNMFGTVVMEIPHHSFETVMTSLKAEFGVTDDNDLTVDHLKELVARYKQVYTKHGKEFVNDAHDQMRAAIFAVFNSWNSERAVKYRQAEGIFGLLGTAVNVQAMCYGNMGDTSGTGVCFTRNPNTGEKLLYGEFLINAQGEDGKLKSIQLSWNVLIYG